MENPCINLKSAGQPTGSDAAPLPALPGAGALNPPKNAPAAATKSMGCQATSFTDLLAAAGEPEAAPAPANRGHPQESQAKAAPKRAARTGATTQLEHSSPLILGRPAAGGNALASVPVERSAEGEGEAPLNPTDSQEFSWRKDGPPSLDAAANPLSTFFYCLPAEAPPAATGIGAETWLQAKLQDTGAPTASNGGNAESPTVSSLCPQTPDISASSAKTMPSGKATAPVRLANRAADAAPLVVASSPASALSTPAMSSTGSPANGQTFNVDKAIPSQPAQIPTARISGAIDTASAPAGDLVFPAASGFPGASTLIPAGAAGDPAAAAAHVANTTHGFAPDSALGSAPGIAKAAQFSTFPAAAPAPRPSSGPNQGSAASQDTEALAAATGSKAIQETAQTTAASILTPPGYTVSFADQPTAAAANSQPPNTDSIQAGTQAPRQGAPLASRPTFSAESGLPSELAPLPSGSMPGANATFAAPSLDPGFPAASASPAAGNLVPTSFAPYPPTIAVQATDAPDGSDANSAAESLPTSAKTAQLSTFPAGTKATEQPSETNSPPQAAGNAGSISGSVPSQDINAMAAAAGAKVTPKTAPAAHRSAQPLAAPLASDLATSPHVPPAVQSNLLTGQSISPGKDQPAYNTEAAVVITPGQNNENDQKKTGSAQAAPFSASQPAINPAIPSAASPVLVTPEATGIPNPANSEGQELNPVASPDSSPLAAPSARNEESTKHGTSPAQQAVDMNNGAKLSQMNQEAGQNLPREAAELAPPAGSAAPTPSEKSPLKTTANTIADSAGLFLRQTPMEIGAQNPNPAPETSQPGGSSGAAMAAKVSDLIANQVVDLKQTGASAMDLVVKTDRQTELHLKLRQEGNTVVVQARCEGGDWQQLSTHWESIKNALSPQGIQLAPLERTPAPEMMATTSGWDQRHKSPSQAGTDSSEQRPARRLAANGPSQISSIPTTKPGGTRTHVPADRHFESWA